MSLITSYSLYFFFLAIFHISLSLPSSPSLSILPFFSFRFSFHPPAVVVLYIYHTALVLHSSIPHVFGLRHTPAGRHLLHAKKKSIQYISEATMRRPFTLLANFFPLRWFISVLFSKTFPTPTAHPLLLHVHVITVHFASLKVVV